MTSAKNKGILHEEGTLVQREIVLEMSEARCTLRDMLRHARLDAPEHFILCDRRGIGGSSILRSNDDREDFFARWGVLCEGTLLSVHAQALLDYHFYLLTRTGTQRISAIYSLIPIPQKSEI